MTNTLSIEKRRLLEQERLDLDKSGEDRNRLGQFATPPELSLAIAKYARKLWGSRAEPVRFLDPAIGSGSFFSALRQVFGPRSISSALGIEIDPAFAAVASALWKNTGLSVKTGDFTKQPPPPPGERYNLILTNPPYVRHHHLSVADKRRLQAAIAGRLGMETNGLAGLYCYFLLLAHEWLAHDGLALWLIPSEFMEVNYGRILRTYLTRKVKLLHIHRFCPSDVQFCDALVTSAIVVFQKTSPPAKHKPRFSFGGSLTTPLAVERVSLPVLDGRHKWTAHPSTAATGLPTQSHTPVLGKLFAIRRGIATGKNAFFILPRERASELAIPEKALKPILPSPRHLTETIIERRPDGWPRIKEQLALIDYNQPLEDIRKRHRRFAEYLQSGIIQGVHRGYLASRRHPWYSQEQRPPPPYLCTYMGRQRNGANPFRFIWNKSQAIAPNVYLLLYPKAALRAALDADPNLQAVVFEALNAIAPANFLAEGRVYGGGLHKMEPKELAALSAEPILDRIHDLERETQLELSFVTA